MTHNPNLAVVCDAEQIVHAFIDKDNNNRVVYTAGSIENPLINRKILDVLEGTWPAFSNRAAKYNLFPPERDSLEIYPFDPERKPEKDDKWLLEDSGAPE